MDGRLFQTMANPPKLLPNTTGMVSPSEAVLRSKRGPGRNTIANVRKAQQFLRNRSQNSSKSRRELRNPVFSNSVIAKKFISPRVANNLKPMNQFQLLNPKPAPALPASVMRPGHVMVTSQRGVRPNRTNVPKAVALEEIK